jgi:hypothetical protein
MSGSHSNTSSTQQVQAMLPQWLSDAWQKANSDVTDFASKPVTAYGGSFSAPVNTDLANASTGINAKVSAPPSANFTAATDALKSNLGFTPSTVTTNPVTAGRVTAPTYSATTGSASLLNPVGDVTAGNVKDVSAYFDPYQQAVVDTTTQDINRQKAVAENAIGARAGSSLWGSRGAILEGETGRSYDDALAKAVAGLRSSGYQQAQTVAGQDASRALLAAQGNQQKDLSVAGQDAAAKNAMTATNLGFTNTAARDNATMGLTAATGNADRGLTADTGNAARDLAAQQGNQSAGQAAAALKASSAGQLAGIDATSRAQDGQFLQMLQTQGLDIQNLQNQDLASRYTEFLRQQQVPYDQINLRLQALGLNPSSQNKTVTGNSTTTKTPGVFDWLTAPLG